MDLPYAEDVGHYFKTSKTGTETWITNAIKQIEDIGGEVLSEAFGSEPSTGRAAFMLTFEIGDDLFRVVFPVLPCKLEGK